MAFHEQRMILATMALGRGDKADATYMDASICAR